MKRWPVGSLAQSAIRAALEAREHVADLSRISAVRVYAEEGAYDHLVKIRQDPWHPVSRETADHSLPYIVAAAVLDGVIRMDSFAPSTVADVERQRFLHDKVTVTPAPELGTIAGGKHKRAEDGYLSRVEIELNDGTIVHGAAKPFPGHRRNPFTDGDLAAKLRENAEPFIGADATQRLTLLLSQIETCEQTSELTALLAAPESAIDTAIME